MNPAWGRVQWGAVMKNVINFCVSQKARTFLISSVMLLDFIDKHCITG